ncbi:MAG: BNR repeat domain protein [uncultured Rubrobacteraceae bacterium]|uniref:BNR repeat domain protein n=1 Tax=uncultured Rubrobacteraceae bacterium TaxID=349277 RepID=A0A6J4PW22_9ACTN|nr:MAG: BNR repeat domain protein [uncultured Rubrobacteraceae bacterium]
MTGTRQGSAVGLSRSAFVMAATVALLAALSLVLASSPASAQTVKQPPNGVVTWGNDVFGQMGDGTAGSPSDPTTANGVGVATAVDAGASHALAVKPDGTVRAWGSNGNGQLGDGSTTTRTSPVTVEGLGDVKGVAGGAGHSLAVKNDGTVWAWGSDGSGASTTPSQVPGLSDVADVAAGGQFSLALKKDGTVWAWGDGQYGQLGHGSTADSSTPVQVQEGLGAPLTGIKAIAAGDRHAVAVKNDGTAWTWGTNALGQLGVNTADSYRARASRVVTVDGVLGNLVSVDAGKNHTVALDSGGNAWAWGDNSQGQIGIGYYGDDRDKATVTRLNDAAAFVAAAGDSSFAVMPDGMMWAWGNNRSGQLGLYNTTTRLPSPTKSKVLTGIEAVSGGQEFAIAHKNDTVAPKTSVYGGPSADLVAATTTEFTVLGGENSPYEFGLYYECSLDGEDYKPCDNVGDNFATQTYTDLSHGRHTFEARAVDGGGLVDQTPASRTWTVDRMPPETSITGTTPEEASSAKSAAFSFVSGGEADFSGFECSMDGATFSACSSPKEYAGLADGAHVFRVRALDALGNRDATPAEYGWTVDTTAPDAPGIASPSEGFTGNTGTFEVKGTAEPGSEVFVYDAASADYPVGSSDVPVGTARADESGNWGVAVSGLGEGDHFLSAVSYDAAGNASQRSAARKIVVDRTPPETSIDFGASGVVALGEAFFAFDSDGTEASYECSLDGEPFGVCPKRLSASYTDLADGNHIFRVRALDAVGNADPTPAERGWTVDRGAPTGTVKINKGAPSTKKRSVTLSLAAADPDPGSGVSKMRFSHNGRLWTDWKTYAPTRAWNLKAGDAGMRTVYVQFADRADNQSAVAKDTIRYKP